MLQISCRSPVSVHCANGSQKCSWKSRRLSEGKSFAGKSSTRHSPDQCSFEASSIQALEHCLDGQTTKYTLPRQRSHHIFTGVAKRRGWEFKWSHSFLGFMVVLKLLAILHSFAWLDIMRYCSNRGRSSTSHYQTFSTHFSKGNHRGVLWPLTSTPQCTPNMYIGNVHKGTQHCSGW